MLTLGLKVAVILGSPRLVGPDLLLKGETDGFAVDFRHPVAAKRVLRKQSGVKTYSAAGDVFTGTLNFSADGLDVVTTDAVTITTANVGYSDTEGTWVIECGWDMSGVSATKLAVSRGSNGRFLYSAGTNIAPGTYDGTTTNFHGDVTSGAAFKIAIGWSGSTRSSSVNGGTVNAVAYDGGWGTGNIGLGAQSFDGFFRSLVFLPRRMSDAELQAASA